MPAQLPTSLLLGFVPLFMSESGYAESLASAEATRQGEKTLEPVVRPAFPAHEDRAPGSVQYGAAVAVEVLASAGPVCSEGSKVPCVLGGGGGLTVRGGYRVNNAWYLGGAYEVARLDANSLLRLPVLQQLRSELRYVIATPAQQAPFLTGGLGAALYGNEWGASTYGLAAFAGVGLEVQLSHTSVLNVTAAYRPLYLKGFVDSAGERRPSALVSFIGLDFSIERREPISY